MRRVVISSYGQTEAEKKDKKQNGLPQSLFYFSLGLIMVFYNLIKNKSVGIHSKGFGYLMIFTSIVRAGIRVDKATQQESTKYKKKMMALGI